MFHGTLLCVTYVATQLYERAPCLIDVYCVDGFDAEPFGFVEYCRN